MSTEKIKIELNRSELKALWNILATVDYLRISTRSEHLMVSFITKAVFKRITSKLLNPGWTETKLGLHTGEAAALLITFNLIDTSALEDVYFFTLINKITNIINQKLT